MEIETESANQGKPQQYGGGRAGGGAPKNLPEGMQGGGGGMSPMPAGANTAQGTYIKIPAKYADKDKSGLTVSLNKGQNQKDFELTD